MSPFQAATVVFLGTALAAPVLSDTVSDALKAATDAYAAGDLKAASDSIAAASAGLAAIQSEKLAAFLPPAPDGWTSEATSDFAAGLAMMGGGSGTEVRYISPEGNAFSISIMADNPMVSGMLGIFSSDMMMAGMGKVIEVDGARLIDQEGTIISVIGQTIMVQATGMDSATMLPVISAVDFKGLAALAE